MNDAQNREAFRALLDGVKARVDDRLATWLAPKVAAAASVSAEVGAAVGALQRLALRGGKRMRAALVAASFDAFGGGPWVGVDHAMLAVELLQVYLLIHDDWMDDDDVRRGGPAVHVALRERLGGKRLGDAAAILAGDLACGFAQTALLESPLRADRVLRAARAFAKTQEEVVTGQLAEMAQAGPTPSVEQVHALKTASYTVTGPLAIGAFLAGVDDARAAELDRFGRPLGVAFQLRDDLLGVFGDPSATGKPVGSDIRQGKRTALALELRGEPLAQRVLGKVDASDEDVKAVVRLMETSGAKARTEARVEELLAEAERALDVLDLPENTGRSALAGAIRALGDRAS